MSQGRAFSSQNFTTLSTNSKPRQPVMNSQQSFQQNITLGASNNNSNNKNPNSTQETLYCDSCQTFRHVSFFNERDFKYNVCNICHSREMQKRKHQRERFEMYEEQQRTLKQAKYQSIQYATPQQQLQSNTPITLNNGSGNNNNNSSSLPPPPQIISSPQIKQSPSISTVVNLSQVKTGNGTGNNNQADNSSHDSHSSNLYTTPNPTSTMRNQSQLQSSMHSQSLLQPTISLPLPNQQHSTSSQQHQQLDIHQLPSDNDSLIHRLDKNILTPTSSLSTTATTTNGSLTSLTLPSANTIIQSNLSNGSASSFINKSVERSIQDMISLDEFVKELENETDFDRRLYHLDIGPLIESMGENAGFTQLGRGICEKVLEGTTYNFSLKDRRRSTKSPDTLSTLRYYCSQRSDTAKPRKAENAKVQNRYDCAGALTIIIDLIKRSAQVTLIHKQKHPAFASQHHHQQQQKKAQQGQQTSQQQIIIMKQQQAHEVEKQFDSLRQTVAEIGLLLEGQQRYGNKDFLNAATEALANAEEFLTACKAHESSNMTLPLNKHTMHYNKRGDQYS